MRKVFQFKITLLGIEPPIWRQIQISYLCISWTLHVVIQDAMVWQNYHMHEFIIINPESNRELHKGIPV